MKKTKESVKTIEESPSTLAFSSPMKRRLLADLTTARANAKNRFKKARMERLRHGRGLDKIFWTVTDKPANLILGKRRRRKKARRTRRRTMEKNQMLMVMVVMVLNTMLH